MAWPGADALLEAMIPEALGTLVLLSGQEEVMQRLYELDAAPQRSPYSLYASYKVSNI